MIPSYLIITRLPGICLIPIYKEVAKSNQKKKKNILVFPYLENNVFYLFGTTHGKQTQKNNSLDEIKIAGGFQGGAQPGSKRACLQSLATATCSTDTEVAQWSLRGGQGQTTHTIFRVDLVI